VNLKAACKPAPGERPRSIEIGLQARSALTTALFCGGNPIASATLEGMRCCCGARAYQLVFLTSLIEWKDGVLGIVKIFDGLGFS
jgi:hypothetical protein